MPSMATRFTTHSPSSSLTSSYIHNCQVKHSTTPAVLLSSFSGRKPPYNTLVFQVFFFKYIQFFLVNMSFLDLGSSHFCDIFCRLCTAFLIGSFVEGLCTICFVCRFTFLQFIPGKRVKFACVSI